MAKIALNAAKSVNQISVVINCGKLWLWKKLENSEFFYPTLWSPCNNNNIILILSSRWIMFTEGKITSQSSE